MKTTNYYDTFIEVAEDCPVSVAEVPPRRKQKTIARLQFELIEENPYTYTSDDVIFGVHATRNDVARKDREEEREQFFSRGRPCLRSSPLTKRYGWGVHSDENGKIAIYAVESDEYETLSKDQELNHLQALRSSRG